MFPLRFDLLGWNRAERRALSTQHAEPADQEYEDGHDNDGGYHVAGVADVVEHLVPARPEGVALEGRTQRTRSPRPMP